jgi:nucleoside transporter
MSDSSVDTVTNVNPVKSSSMPLLGLMMFLQFFIWGGWYVSVTGWLNDLGLGGLTVWVYSVCPIAAILSPVFLGVVADRFFASQKVLSALHLIGALFMMAIPLFITKEHPGAVSDTVWLRLFHPAVLLMLGNALCFMPTLALSSSVALTHVASAERQFPVIRVAGTIGWIVAGLVVGMFLPGGESSPGQFYLVAGAGITLSVLAWFLPHTPPPLAGKKVSVGQVLGLDAIALLKKRQFAVFILCSLLICIPLSAYYQQTRNYVEYSKLPTPEALQSVINATLGKLSDGFVVSGDLGATAWMSLGQMSEVLFMLLMPVIILRLGVKKMLLFGMIAWVVRYGLFALGAPDQIAWMVIVGILLHGICYDFFFVAGQIYVDNDTPHEIRGQAQSLFLLITQGVGMLIGAQVVNAIVEANSVPVVNWQPIWFWCAMFAAVIAVIFLIFFKPKNTSSASAQEAQ